MRLLNWLWDPENRAVASFAGAGLAALAIGVWTVFTYLHKDNAVQKDSPVTERTIVKIYHVCRGENGFHCVPDSFFIGCRTFDEWLSEQQCIKWKFGEVTNGPIGDRCATQLTTLYCTTNP